MSHRPHADPSAQCPFAAHAPREAGGALRAAPRPGFSHERQELKFRIHRKLLDRVKLDALSGLPGERVRAELRAQLGNEAFAREIVAGQRLTLDDLLAIPHRQAPAPARAAPPAVPGEACLEVFRVAGVHVRPLTRRRVEERVEGVLLERLR